MSNENEEREEQEERKGTSNAGIVLLVLAGVVVSVVAGTLLTVVAHYVGLLLGVSETSLVLAYMGLLAIGVFAVAVVTISHQVQFNAALAQREALEELLNAAVLEEEEEPAVAPPRSPARRRKRRSK